MTIGGQFVLENRVHAGAHAEVWRAHDPQGAAVAVKLSEPTTDSRTRLAAEHAWLARLGHAAIVRPVAWIDDSNHAALVTEYLPGGDLVSLSGAPPRHWVNAIADVADALAYLHGRSLVHRDLKARNVLFDSAGRARLIDFGSVAVVGSPRTSGGTTAAHRYTSTGTISATDDVFAFAVLVYELIAGRLPFGPEPKNGAQVAAPPLSAPLRRRPALAALEKLVLDALQARDSVETRNIQPFRDGIKLLIAEEAAHQ